MTDYVFVGRRRHLVRILVYGVLTLGIYGRILAYRQVKDIDGHRALFIDLRVVKALLWLPLLGPLTVKLKLRRMLAETVHHDITHPPVPRNLLAWLALIPIVPAFHMVVQNRLNIYWRRQQKYEDIKHRRAEIDRLSKGKRTDEKKAAIKDLEDQIKRREQALQDEEEAAAAIREAEKERRRAEAELKSLHKGPVARLGAKVKAAIPTRSTADEKGSEGKTQDEQAQGDEQQEGLASRLRGRFRRSGESTGEDEDAAEPREESPAEADPPEESPAEAEEKVGFATRLKGIVKRSPQEPDEKEEPKPSKTERRAARKAAKAAKADAKENTDADEGAKRPRKKKGG